MLKESLKYVPWRTDQQSPLRCTLDHPAQCQRIDIGGCLSCSRTQRNLLESGDSRAWSKVSLLTTLDRESQVLLLFLIHCRKHHCDVMLLESSIPFLLLPGLASSQTTNKRFASLVGRQARSCWVRRATEAGSGPQQLSPDTEEITRLHYQFVKRGVSSEDLNIYHIMPARIWSQAHQLMPDTYSRSVTVTSMS